MSNWIDFARWDLDALAREWRQAKPFPHVILDGAVGGERVRELREAMAKEPHWPGRGELFDFLSSTENLQNETLRAFRDALSSDEARRAIAAITGKEVGGIEMRSFVYLAGHYLLPHSDWREGVNRSIAYALYLTPKETCKGGELKLYDCAVERGEISRAVEAKTVEHREGRLVLFDVALATLHRVCEVQSGARLSLAGWFLHD